MTLIGSALSSGKSIKTIFPYVMKKTESYENYFMIYEKNFDKDFMDIINEDERITGSEHSNFLYDMSTKYLDSNGDEKALYMGFITKDNEEKLERFRYRSSLSEEKIASLRHPIYMPFSAENELSVKEGDTFSMVYGTRKFDFEVAGFWSRILLK